MWTYTVRDDQGGHPRWWLRNASDVVMAVSGESFSSHANALNAARNFKEQAAQWRYVSFPGSDGYWYWHAQATNGHIVASGGRRFASQADANAAANAVRVNGGTATGP